MSSQRPSFLYPSTDENLIPFLDRRWTEGVAHRRAADLRAFWNIAFTHGQQWLYEGDRRAESTLQRLPVDEDDPNAPVLITVNKVASYVNRAIARITKENPKIECRPVSDEDSDVDAARVGTRISASEDERMDLTTLLPRLYTWVVPAGWAFLQTEWDTEQGRLVGKDPDDGETDLHEGQVTVDIAPHYEVVLDPMSTDADTARWAIRQYALTPEEIWERWEQEVEKPIGLYVLTEALADLAMNKGAALDTGNRIAVRRFWLRPGASRQFPEGFVFTWSGQTVLEARKPWPYKHQKRVPLIQFNYLPPQGGYFGRTPVSDLIDQQIDYNRARSLEADISSRLLPKVFYPAGSIPGGPESITARVEWIPFLPGGQPPEPWSFDPGWMQQHELIMKRSAMEMDEVMGESGASRGTLAGTSPGVTVLAQQEASAEPYAIPAKELSRGLKEFGHQRLLLIKQYWKEQRLVRAWSRAGTLAVERFSNSDIEGEMDVFVNAESALPRSKAARAQLAIQLAQNQVPGFDIRHFVRMVELPGTDILSETFDADERHAERENQYIAVKARDIAIPTPADTETAAQKKLDRIAKELPMVNPRDNHLIHIETHRLHMISPEFESYSDKVKAFFEAHISQHEALLAQKQQSQPQQGQPTQNGSGGGGTALPPGQPSPSAVAAGLTPGPATPEITDLAMMGGRAGQPGVPPGIPPDQAAAAVGR